MWNNNTNKILIFNFFAFKNTALILVGKFEIHMPYLHVTQQEIFSRISKLLFSIKQQWMLTTADLNPLPLHLWKKYLNYMFLISFVHYYDQMHVCIFVVVLHQILKQCVGVSKLWLVLLYVYVCLYLCEVILCLNIVCACVCVCASMRQK